jgi:FkbM family methyltransferase
MIFDDLLNIENCIDLFFETQDREQPIIFFGAGFALKRILLKFEKHGLNIVCVCDNDKSKQGTCVQGRYEVLSIENCILRFPNALYVISSPLYFWEIKKFLESKIENEHICNIDFECGHYFSGTDFKAYFIKNIKRFKKFYESLNDEISKQTLYNISKAHISGNRHDFEYACTGTDDWYLFKSLLKPCQESVYLDCGACDGDTVFIFYNSAINGYKSIFAFEPDETNHLKLQNTISNNNIPNVQIIKKGVYDFDGRLRFTQDGVYSAVTNSNKSLQPPLNAVEIDVTTIDSVLNGEFVDIIKMDIEGAEYKALLGAESSIKKHKPRLAICLYHNIEDFIEIAELMLRMVPDYKLFLRHHFKSCTDTILYAVP